MTAPDPPVDDAAVEEVREWKTIALSLRAQRDEARAFLERVRADRNRWWAIAQAVDPHPGSRALLTLGDRIEELKAERDRAVARAEKAERERDEAEEGVRILRATERQRDEARASLEHQRAMTKLESEMKAKAYVERDEAVARAEKAERERDELLGKNTEHG